MQMFCKRPKSFDVKVFLLLHFLRNVYVSNIKQYIIIGQTYSLKILTGNKTYLNKYISAVMT